MARATGLEPATSGVTGRHSNRLSYARTLCRRPAGLVPATRRGLCGAPRAVKQRNREMRRFGDGSPKRLTHRRMAPLQLPRGSEGLGLRKRPSFACDGGRRYVIGMPNTKIGGGRGAGMKRRGSTVAAACARPSGGCVQGTPRLSADAVIVRRAMPLFPPGGSSKPRPRSVWHWRNSTRGIPRAGSRREGRRS